MTIFAGKKKWGKQSGQNKIMCASVHGDLSYESAKSQKQIIQRAIGYKKKKKFQRVIC